MNQQSTMATLANRIYWLMLFAYPAPFRREFGPHMAQVFRDDMRGTLHESGPLGLLGLWLITFFDLLKTAFAEHIWEIFHMPVEKLTRWSGLAAALGAPLLYMTFASDFFWKTYWSLGLPDGDMVHPILAGFGLLLMGIGLYGLYRLLPRTLASKIGLAVALIGVAIGIMGMILWNQMNTQTFVLASFVLPTLGLAIMGLVAFRDRSLGRLSFIPLLISASFVVMLITAENSVDNQITRILLILSYLGWIFLGAAMVLNHSSEEPSEPGLFA
jgi:tryptophan-rich sensory protein